MAPAAPRGRRPLNGSAAIAALIAVGSLVFVVGCGGDDVDDGAGGNSQTGVGGDGAGGASSSSGPSGPGAGGMGGTGMGGSGAGMPVEPCDFMSPEVVTVGQTVTRDVPSQACDGGAHFYRFAAPTTGVYTITKSGEASLGFCEGDGAGGCICGANINCCSDCTLTFDLADGSPLPAGANNEIYVDGSTSNGGTYTFTITGPD